MNRFSSRKQAHETSGHGALITRMLCRFTLLHPCVTFVFLQLEPPSAWQIYSLASLPVTRRGSVPTPQLQSILTSIFTAMTRISSQNVFLRTELSETGAGPCKSSRVIWVSLMYCFNVTWTSGARKIIVLSALVFPSAIVLIDREKNSSITQITEGGSHSSFPLF